MGKKKKQKKADAEAGVQLAEDDFMTQEITDWIIESKFTNYADFIESAMNRYPDEYWPVLMRHSDHFDRCVRGMNIRELHTLDASYLQKKARRACPYCGSDEYKTYANQKADGKYKCSRCGKNFF
jgi:DNA-directed RNA polymerase subunit RPC12/RpoP